MKLLHKFRATSYDDICIHPEYSDLDSRSEADISFYPYRNPIINSPMIHTTGKHMLRYLQDNNMMMSVHRYFDSATEQMKWVWDVKF